MHLPANRPRQHSGGTKQEKVCVLSRFAGRQLEHWDIQQPCHGRKCRHKHMRLDEVTKLVAQGVLRWIGPNMTIAAYTEHREWRRASSAGYTVMQLR
jgi:hypothetical protein